ncbi:MAG TPA: imidazole glycerol phosphate synthase subunit HisH, partial [bacterium]|nr:imidazole glycerol phosphate synthase subunit HisH [bacterium]
SSGKPFLGICLGMQLLFSSSEEDGDHAGLGLIPGKVVRFPDRPGFHVPHMGWNQLEFPRPGVLFAGVAPGAHVYFVHSYYPVPDDPGVVAAVTDYGGPVAAAVERGNVFGVQFHPEKSQAVGLRIVANFVGVCGGGR